MKKEETWVSPSYTQAPNTSYSGAPPGWIHLSSYKTVALSGLGKAKPGLHHYHDLKKVGKQHLPALCCWRNKAGRMPRNRSHIRAVQIITITEEASACPLRVEVLVSSKASRAFLRRVSPTAGQEVRYPGMHSCAEVFELQLSAPQLHVLCCLVEG